MTRYSSSGLQFHSWITKFMQLAAATDTSVICLPFIYSNCVEVVHYFPVLWVTNCLPVQCFNRADPTVIIQQMFVFVS